MVATPTRPATPADNTPLDRAYLRAPALPTFPFPTERALQYTRDTYTLHEDDELAIVEASAIRYGKLPATEQDGSFEWLVDAEFDALDAERRADYEDAYAERCGGW